MMKSNTLFDKVVLLMLGFVLTTVAGSFLSYRYQIRAWEREDLAQRKQDELARASVIFDDISKLLDRRLYRTRSVVWALKDRMPKSTVDQQREVYRVSLAEWNESLNRNLALIERYFGTDLRSEFEGEITDKFRDLHNELSSIIKNPTDSGIVELEESLNNFNPTIYMFNLEMLECIQRGEVGAFMRKYQ